MGSKRNRTRKKAPYNTKKARGQRLRRIAAGETREKAVLQMLDHSRPTQLCENLHEGVQSNYNVMNLHPAQLEYGDLAISDVSGEENPVIFHVVPQTIEAGMPDVTIETEMKQEIEDIPETLCNDSSPSNLFVSCDRGSSTHVTEDGQQFVTLCEVYMPPSPTSIKDETDVSDDESIPDCIVDLQKIKRLKREVSSLRKQLANLECGLRTFLDEDQLLYLRHKSPQGFTWSESTLRKAKKLQAVCGAKGYNSLCEMGYPLPGKWPVDQKTKQFSVKLTRKS